MEENNSTQVSDPQSPQPISIENQKPSQIDVENKSTKPKLLKIVGILILIILVVLIALTFFYREPILNLVAKPTPTPAVSISPSPTPPAGGPTANWQTYEGDGFSFKYPLYWVAIENKTLPNVTLRPKEFTQIMPDTPTIAVELRSRTLDTYPQGNEKEQGIDMVTNWKTVMVDGVGGIYYQFHNCAPQCTAETVLPIDQGKTVVIRISSIAQVLGYTTIYDQILSTFKFTDSQDIDTSNWKTLEGDGFSLMYPSMYKLKSNNADRIVFEGTFDENQIIAEELIINIKPTVNYQQIPSCEENNKETCAEKNLDTDNIVTINRNDFRAFGLNKPNPVSQTGQGSMLYIVHTLENPKIEFVHKVLGGGVEDSMNQILSTLKFTE